ncbi:hypothetical protein G6F31_011789 [Rhizopus arrhizus]|nr:hypothetical protein G6F31_011789 [Rhizopus arrhizus]
MARRVQLRGTAQVRPCSLDRAIHGAHAPATGPTPPLTDFCCCGPVADVRQIPLVAPVVPGPGGLQQAGESGQCDRRRQSGARAGQRWREHGVDQCGRRAATAASTAQPGRSAVAAGAAGEWPRLGQLQHRVRRRGRRRYRAGGPAARSDQPGAGAVYRAWPDARALFRKDQSGLRRDDVAAGRGRRRAEDPQAQPRPGFQRRPSGIGHRGR